MPSISFKPQLHARHLLGLPWPQRLDALQWWTYQLGAYLAIHLLEDPAWMAFIFC